MPPPNPLWRQRVRLLWIYVETIKIATVGIIIVSERLCERLLIYAVIVAEQIVARLFQRGVAQLGKIHIG
ncbi:MAG: hypothetical protein LBT47_12545 [Deltaproteobacteria bacterium]|nr:hypothetical protein [Deltaproteobacteria bacterium]